jgi:predicted  nucleic acid-binding Zn-ribbon protein
MCAETTRVGRRLLGVGALCSALVLGLTQPALALPGASFGAAAAGVAAEDAASDTQQQIDRINASLDQLEQEAASAGDAAVQAQSSADQAQRDLADSEAALTDLRQRVQTAQAEVDAQRQRSGAAVQQLTRGTDGLGGEPVVQLMTSDDVSGALWRASALSQVSAQADAQVRLAAQQASELQALQDQQATVEAEHRRLSEQAASDAAQAQQSAQAADQAVADLQQRQGALLQQLADIKRTTAEQEAEERRQRQLAASIAASNEPQTTSGAAQSSGSAASSTPAASAPASSAPATSRPSSSPSSAPSSSASSSSRSSTPSSSSSSGDNSPAAAQAYAQSRLNAMGQGGQFVCLVNLWNRESGWRWNASNRSSGAYGIPQSLPGSKMASAGADWRKNARTQVDWGLSYITGRYGTPCGAWQHSQTSGWY